MDYSIKHLLEEAVASHPKANALVDDTRSLTYEELAGAIQGTAEHLLETGSQPGDRIAFHSRNSVDAVVLTLGAIEAGLVVVPMNWRLNVSELAAILVDAGVDRVFSTEEYRQVSVEAAARTNASVEPLRDATAHSGSRSVVKNRAPLDLAALIYTSGTSGRPKGVMLSEEALLYAARQATAPWQFDGNSVHLVVSPMYHASGIMNVLTGLWAGASNRLLADAKPGPILELIECERVTNVMMVPALLKTVVEASESGQHDLSSLRTLVFGSDRTPMTILERGLKTLGPVLTQGYGLSETGGAVCSSEPRDLERHINWDFRLATVGRPFDGVEMRISGADGANQTGEIQLRGPQNMSGYWQMPDETKAVFTEDGYFRTGDLGYVDQDGFLYVVDRLKELIISGGENIYPAEVERLLASHPHVSDAAVVGVPDEKWGEVVAAYVTCWPGQTVTSEELNDYCRQNLARYKCPKRIVIAEELPRNSVGKIVKNRLRQDARTSCLSEVF